MNWFNNLKTLNKIISLIVLISILFSIAGLIGYYYNKKTDKIMRFVYSNNLLPIEWLSETSTLAYANESNLLELIIQDNLTKKIKLVESIERRQVAVDQYLKNYQNTDLDQYEKEKLPELKAALMTWRNITTKVIRLTDNNRSSQAYSYLKSRESDFIKFQNILRDLTIYNEKLAETTQDENTRTTALANNLILGILAFTFILSIILGYLVAHKIVDPLVSIVKKIRKFAGGDLLVEPALVKSKDEVGELASSFNIMSGNLRDLIHREQFLRQIITDLRVKEGHDEIYMYLLHQLISIFDVPRSLHLHYNKNNDLFVQSELVKDQSLELLKDQILVPKADIQDIISNLEEVAVVTDIEKEIHNSNLRDYLKSVNIQAFLLYSTIVYSEQKDKEVLGFTMIASPYVRKWSLEDINLFRLIIDATSLTFLEFLQRKEVDEIRRTFLATLTHDLRSPINAEQKALEAILSSKLGTSLDDFSEYLQDIYKTNEELLRIVNNILTIYHYESGRFELKLEPNNISEIIANSVRSMKPLARDQDSEIITNIQENLPLIISDKDEITRVIINLINNAIKHNPKGNKIFVTARKINNEVQIAVSDNGSGIPESEIPNIFQRYPTAKRKIGTGLGLYLSKQIIEAHKGKIWFETEKGKGTTFYFNIPL